MFYKCLIFTGIIILNLNLVFSQDVAKITKEFNAKYKSTLADDRVQAVQSLKALEYKASLNLLLKVFEENNPKVLKAAQEVVESYNAHLELATLLLPKGVASIKNEFGRAYLINALGKFHFPEVNAGLFKLLKVSVDPNVAVPVIEAIGALGFEESIPELISYRKNALYTRHFGFRTSLFEALIQFPNKQVVEFFINTLEENEGIISVQTQEYLALVTSSRQTSAANWKKWWAENKETLTIRKITQEEISKKLLEIKPEGEVPYYGMSILAKRIVFIVDTSGSMIIANEKGSRLDVAKKELISVINSLSDKIFVEVISFSSNASPWYGDLKPLTKAFKVEVEKRIANKDANGGTNTYASFEKAFLVSDNLEAIYFMSDGAPSVGDIIDKDDLLDQVFRWNRFRKLQINSIGLIFGKIPPDMARRGLVEDPAKLKFLLTQLAVQNKGQFKFVE